MTSDASSPRPRKRQRTSRELKLIKDHARVNGGVEPPIPYVRRSSISPVRPTPSDLTPIADAKTTIVSRRYRNKCGEPIYTVRIEYASQDGDAEREEREVEMDDIEDFVSKAELERFELDWFDPDEVMPGIVIGAVGFERTQTWETPSSTGEDDNRPRLAASNTKKTPSQALVDKLPSSKRRGRPPKRTAAVMGVKPAKSTMDGASESNSSDGEASYDLDNIEDEVDPASMRRTATTATPGRVRGVGGYVLIPSRSGAVASNQCRVGATAEPHRIKNTKPSLTPISSASVSQEPEDLLSGFNPRRSKEDHGSLRNSTKSASPNVAPRRQGRPPKSAAARKSIPSLLAYTESEEFGRDSNASKSPCPEEPLHELETNTPAEKVSEKGEEMPRAHEPDEHNQQEPASHQPETPKARLVQIIEISSDSESSDKEEIYFGPTAEQRRDPRYAEAIKRAEAGHKSASKNVAVMRQNVEANHQARSNAPPVNAPRPRTPAPHKSPSPAPANSSPARRIRAHTLAPALPRGATAETAICLDDDDESAFDPDREYSFSKVVDLKIFDGQKYYLIQWDENPCPPPDYSWYTEEELGEQLGPRAFDMVERLIEEKLRRPSSPATMARDRERLLGYRGIH